jgi:SAM-dependent methyltransferase
MPGDFPIVRCRRCGLVYVNPRPTKEAISDYYPKDYVPHNRSVLRPNRKLATLWHGYSRLFTGPNIDLLDDVEPDRCLDVGTGNGEYLRILSERGWDAVGVEPDHDAVAVALNGGLQVYEGEIRDVGLPEQSLGAVTFRGSFEHIHDPLGTLREVHRVCRDDGVLLIEVPNFACPEVRIFGKWWTPVEAPRHLYHYTKGTLTALLQRSGFAVVRVQDQYCYRSAVDSLSERLGGHWPRILQNHVFYGLALPATTLLAWAYGEGHLLRVRAKKA